MKRAELNYTKAGYSYIKCTKEDCLEWGGAAICDNCNEEMEGEVYLIFILARALCKECFEEWQERSVKYPEDIMLQNQNQERWYRNYGFDISEEEKQ